MPDTEWLTTERLALRPFTPHDLDWLAERYYDDHPGFGMWITIERDTGNRLGFHLLNHIEGESIIQVGFGLIKSAWGKGYATEMGLASDGIVRTERGAVARAVRTRREMRTTAAERVKLRQASRHLPNSHWSAPHKSSGSLSSRP